MSHHLRRIRCLALLLALALTVGASGTANGETPELSTELSTEPSTEPSTGSVAPGTILFEDRFEGPPGLITNAYAFLNPTDPDAVVDPEWGMIRGSMYGVYDAVWTGVPDDTFPDATSSESTGSSRFRIYAKQHPDIGDARVSLRVLPVRMVSSSKVPKMAYDGIHIWLRGQSDKELYAASVMRRNGTVVIKKKCLGGTQNGGTYYALSRYVHDRPLPFGTISTVAAEVVNVADGVRLRLWQNDELVIDVVDDGVGCRPLAAPGYVGLRVDNTELYLDDFLVTAAGPPAPSEAPKAEPSSSDGQDPVVLEDEEPVVPPVAPN